MALRTYTSMEHDDDQKHDLSKGMPRDWEPPDYPTGLQFSISKEDLEQASGSDSGKPDDTMRFAAMGEVTSIFLGREDCRIELEISQFAGEDGKFFDLDMPTHICLCGPDLEKLELDADCERGDMIHLIGTVRMESASSTEYGGDMVTLQITELSVEDESTEQPGD